MCLKNLVPWMIWEVSGILEITLLSDSCCFSECVLAVLSGVLVVTDVCVFRPTLALLTLIVRL